MNHRGQYDQPRGVQHRVTAHRWKALDLCLRIRAAAHHENQLAGRYELISHDFSLLVFYDGPTSVPGTQHCYKVPGSLKVEGR